MMKEFIVDKKLKAKIIKQIKKSAKEYSWLRAISKVFTLMIFMLPIGFIVYAYAISDEFVHMNDFYAPEGTKNHFLIFTVAGTIGVLAIFFKVIIATIQQGLSVKKIYGRYNECLIYEKGVLQYEYEELGQQNSEFRSIVRIPVAEIGKAEYHQKTKKLVIDGIYSQKFYLRFELPTENVSDYKNGTFEIYDYFKPDLKTFLSEEGLNIKRIEG